MSTEELLETRIKIIAGWPGMEDDEYEVGQIHCGNYSDLNKEVIEKYPHLFKPLQWWEEREVKDMPEYVKWTHPGVKTLSDYFKVFQWQKNSVGAWLCDVKEAHLYISDIVPATETEYNEYLKQSKK